MKQEQQRLSLIDGTLEQVSNQGTDLPLIPLVPLVPLVTLILEPRLTLEGIEMVEVAKVTGFANEEVPSEKN